MKKLLFVTVVLALAVLACGQTAPTAPAQVVEVTRVVVATAQPTARPQPTAVPQVAREFNPGSGWTRDTGSDQYCDYTCTAWTYRQGEMILMVYGDQGLSFGIFSWTPDAYGDGVEIARVSTAYGIPSRVITALASIDVSDYGTPYVLDGWVYGVTPNDNGVVFVFTRADVNSSFSG